MRITNVTRSKQDVIFIKRIIKFCHVRMYPYTTPAGPTKVTSGPIAMRLISGETVNPFTYISTICAMCVYSKSLTPPGLGTTLCG